jgi:GxxExxY protein
MTEDRIQTAAEYLPEGRITGEIIGVFFNVYNALGFGFLESVYRRAMRDDLRARGLDVKDESPISVRYNGREVGHFRLDLLVEDRVAVELKATMLLGPTDKRQLLNYLRATNLEVGLLLHFGPDARFIRVTPPRRFRTNQATEIRGDP